ncbi:MAG: transposase [Candidatus Levybacteria bacterium]|nr:transposase [Candidatus Levybacteria bacterium]MBP9814973.1 transposase [Candidatus Levybacteria bacterium]
MPARNIVKSYVAGGYYHIYNRGVERRDIFLDKQDCVVFQRYLKLYLAKPSEVANIDVPRIQIFLQNNLHDELDLLAFSLMPNHIHLQVRQVHEDSISKLMKRLITSYVMYFNRKYKRVGPLFQNRYKAALIEGDSYLLHLSRYIHLNPTKINNNKIDFNDFCSLPYYLGEKESSWLKYSEILSYFNGYKRKDKGKTYKDFVISYSTPAEKILGNMVIEDDVT